MKKLIGLFVLMITLVCVLALSASAATVDSGTCGDDLTWTLNNYGRLTISGTGAMSDYTSGKAPWYSHRLDINVVEFSDGIEHIGRSAFYGMSKITDVYFDGYDSDWSKVTVDFGNNILRSACMNFSKIDYIIVSGYKSFELGKYVELLANTRGVNKYIKVKSATVLTNDGISESFDIMTASEASLTNILSSISGIYTCTIDADGYYHLNETSLRYRLGDFFPTTNNELAFNEYYEALPYNGERGGILRVYDNTKIFLVDPNTFKVTRIAIPQGQKWSISNVNSSSGFYTDRLGFGDVSLLNKDRPKYGISSVVYLMEMNSCGDNLTYSYNGAGTLTISGTGEMWDYTNGIEVPWHSVLPNITDIVIENGVTSVGGAAFSGCTSITSVCIPDSVTVIGDNAFVGCNSLTSINIPDSVTSIENGAFAGCSSLTSISIPDSVTSIADGAFYKCTSLTSIDIPDGVTSICNGTFEYCTSLASISIPDSVTYIGNYAFYGCASFNDVYYNGSEIDWAAVHIGSYNSSLANATIHYGRYLLGDIDGDGSIDIKDYFCLNRSLANWEGYEEYKTKAAADLNKDGSVDAEDSTILSRALAGWSAYKDYIA